MVAAPTYLTQARRAFLDKRGAGPGNMGGRAGEKGPVEGRRGAREGLGRAGGGRTMILAGSGTSMKNRTFIAPASCDS